MFILLQSDMMLNMCWLQDCHISKINKNIVVFYMVNGSEIIEQYETEIEAKDRETEIHNKMSNFTLNINS